MQVDIKKIIDYRLKLHRHPELSGVEYKTSAFVEEKISRYNPDEIIALGTTGKAFVFDSQKAGPTTMFRSELDALAITEPDDFCNKSRNAGVSHKCGHDGHIAILIGLAEAISNNRPKCGKVVILFQPAEETLTGAEEILKDENFKKIEPDFIFAIHNLPGYDEAAVIYKENNFTCATTGITIELTGNTSHAAAPEKANNPTDAVLELSNFIRKELDCKKFKEFILATPVYTRIGTPDFGITPGNAELKVTLRANNYSDLKELSKIIQNFAINLAEIHNLKLNISFSDETVPVKNSTQAIEMIKKAAKENNLKLIKNDAPFRWTEDFGYFTQKYKGAMVGFGAGQIPALHDKHYDFQDNIILPAINLFYSIYKQNN